MKGMREVVQRVGSMWVGMEDAEFKNHTALGSGQPPTIFIRYYYFYGKRDLQQFRLSYLPAGIGCQVWIQCQFSTVGVHGWCARVCLCVCMCVSVCVCGLSCLHVPFSVCVHGVGIRGSPSEDLLATSYLQHTSLMCQEL